MSVFTLCRLSTREHSAAETDYSKAHARSNASVHLETVHRPANYCSLQNVKIHRLVELSCLERRLQVGVRMSSSRLR
jgi:hypothetical protein